MHHHMLLEVWPVAPPPITKRAPSRTWARKASARQPGSALALARWSGTRRLPLSGPCAGSKAVPSRRMRVQCDPFSPSRFNRLRDRSCLLAAVIGC